ncbi:MAG: tRNA epoxyqueuosine(34) reductase QueG [Planctomycetales bacterium]|nr:tRNA epoxyqueuosine(34) reductase QueG [Planctomycetales bacterium]
MPSSGCSSDPRVAALRERAAALGFARCGIAAAGPAPGAGRLREWLGAGRHGEMGYMARTADDRADPRRLLPGVRSVLTLLANYWAGPEGPAPPGAGVVARYARGEDYHRVLGARLRRFTAALAEVLGATESFLSVDTGAVLEKAWAEAAGVGWTGRHTNLVSRDLGSWTFLGVVLTTADLPPDAPQGDFCGTCDRCLRACPTGAIVAPYQLDARLCISYLTIELRGPIPRPLRPLLGNRVFGCDDCLAVCPWNRFAREARDPALAPPRGLAFPDLVGLLRLGEEEYRERYRATALHRARRSGLRRNAAVALGNVGGPAAAGPLAEALGDPAPLVRGHAAWALGAVGGPVARGALAERAGGEADAWVAEEIGAALEAAR